MRTVLSLLPEAMYFPLGDQATAMTLSVWLEYMNDCSFPVLLGDQTCTVLSSLDEVIQFPSGDHERPVIGPACWLYVASVVPGEREGKMEKDGFGIGDGNG